jgi:uncharacterized protein YecT (DUF1311 family)
VSDGIRASPPPVAGLLDVTLRYRDAPPCDASTASEELQYCLPKSLHSAQRNWIRQRDKSCGVEEITRATEAGWLAYVLSDIAKAQCVLQHTRERVTALQTQ